MKIVANVKSKQYPIIIGESVETIGKILRKNGFKQKNVIIFTSPNIARLYLKAVNKSLTNSKFKVKHFEIESGEKNKNINVYYKCISAIFDNFPNESENPLIINIGGGVISDIGGFVAATFRRGIPYVSIPTTLLSMVDAGIGGKVGINFVGESDVIKNSIGSIHQPSMILCDTNMLKSLPSREIISGFGEVVKYMFICDSSKELEIIAEKCFKKMAVTVADSDNRTAYKINESSLLAFNELIKKCCEYKLKHVENDEMDNLDKRIMLNFGHTIGHGIEGAANYKLTHGEAVLIGMMAEIELAERLGLINAENSPSVDLNFFIIRKQLIVSSDAKKFDIPIENVMRNIYNDKKNKDSKIRFVYPILEDGNFVAKIGETKNIKLIRKIVEKYI